MIEPLPHDAWSILQMQIPAKINEVIDAVNRLEQLAKLNLGAPDPHRAALESDREFVAKHSEQPKTGPGIVRRPKEKP